MSKPRPWPNAAKEARDRSAEEAIRVQRALKPLLTRDVTRDELFRRLAVALDAAQMISRLLEGQGAQTRP